MTHIPFIVILGLFPVVKRLGKRDKKKGEFNATKKIGYKKDFYSNDFEEKLKSLNESLVELKAGHV